MKNSIILILTLSFFISCKNEPKELIRIEGALLEISPSIEADERINSMVQPYKERVESEMKTVLSYTPIDLVRTDAELESSLGNLLADLCYERANPVFHSRHGATIDFAMFNYGGIRSGITKGAITNEHAFKLMPFENLLVVVEMTAEKVTELVDYLIRGNRPHPISKHLNIKILDSGYELRINGEKLDDKRTYFVLTTDYLQNLGDNMLHFKNAVNVFNLDYKMRNAIIDYLKEKDTIKSVLDGRFQKIK